MSRRLVTSLAAALALAGAHSAGAQTPGSLTGAVLNGAATPSLGIGAVTIDCEPTGTSTGTYSVVGTALGPFPGTYEETGSFLISDGQVTAYEADFTIQSGLTEIDGTKALRTSISAVCTNDPEPTIAAFTNVAVTTSYEATISTPVGTFTDEGRTSSGAQMLTTPDGRASAATQTSLISEAPLITPTTSGHVTGGGFIGDVVDEWVSFGFSAKSDGSTAKAQCSVSDRSARIDIKCLDATSLTQTATHATFVGNARVDGEPTTYRIDVNDAGGPAAGGDTFTIQTASGFTASGVLAGGNIQIHD
jgi:hypothetical protein